MATVALQHAAGTDELGRLVLEHVPPGDAVLRGARGAVPARAVSVSLGLCLSAWVERPDQLLVAGDRAMYAVKAAGGGQVCLAERTRPVAPAPHGET